MRFDAKQFLNDNQIRWTDSGPNSHDGWIQVNCPFCGDRSFHGGFSLSMPAYNCWRCRGHKLIDVIIRLTDSDRLKARFILSKYITGDTSQPYYDIQRPREGVLELPVGCGELTDRHIKYLEDRGFDCEKIVREWDLRGTGHIGDYKFRIIAPIYLNNKMVSFQGRDITGKSSARYKACSKDNELYHHKYMLYGIDNVRDRKAVIVEGITDVWKLGYGAIATFGIEFTYQQVMMICDALDRAVILYDNSDTAQAQADALYNAIVAQHNKVTSLEIATLTDVDDPGDLPDSKAEYIKRKLLK